MEMAKKKRIGVKFLREKSSVCILEKYQKAAIACIRQSGGEMVTMVNCSYGKHNVIFVLNVSTHLEEHPIVSLMS